MNHPVCGRGDSGVRCLLSLPTNYLKEMRYTSTISKKSPGDVSPKSHNPFQYGVAQRTVYHAFLLLTSCFVLLIEISSSFYRKYLPPTNPPPFSLLRSLGPLTATLDAIIRFCPSSSVGPSAHLLRPASPHEDNEEQASFGRFLPQFLCPPIVPRSGTFLFFLPSASFPFPNR